MNNSIWNVATVFSGIGSAEWALKRLNINHRLVFACDNGDRDISIDIDKELEIIRSLPNSSEKKRYVDSLYSQKTRKKNHVKLAYLANHPLLDNDYFEDIRLFDGNDFRGKVDLLIGGSPCQSFSSIGSGRGFDDARGTLFYDFARLIHEIQPKAFIYENVRGITTHDNGQTLSVIYSIFDNLGYDFDSRILDSKDYGIPQTRRRFFAIGYKKANKAMYSIPNIHKELKFTMQDFLEEKNAYGSLVFDVENGKITLSNTPGNVDESYFLSEAVDKYVMSSGTKCFYQKPVVDLKIARPILATMGNCHRAGIDNYITIEGKRRMLTEREALRLMGFTDEFKIVVSKAQTYRQAGNAIVVDVMMSLIESIINYLDEVQ